MPPKQPSENMATLNQQQAAYLLGVTSRSLRDWSDVPRNPDGTYDGAAVVAWWARRNCSESDFDNQRERLAAAQAEKVETENALRRGELADMAAVLSVWVDHIMNARAKLLALPAKLGPQLVNCADAASIAGKIRHEVYASLNELAHEGGPAHALASSSDGVGAAS